VGRYEIGDATLGRETARTIDVTLRGRSDLGSEWTLGAFAHDFRDYLYLQPTGATTDGLPEFRYRQGDARFVGLEAEWRHLLQRGDGARQQARWELRLAGDLVRGSLSGGDPLPQMPPARLMAGLSRSSGAWNTRLDLHWTAAQGRVAPGESSTHGGLAVDLALNWAGRWRGLSVSAFIKGSNLLDRDLRRHVSPLKDYVPLPGRGVAAGLRVGF
jgi:iron complex outermembrane receptor protein